MTSRNPVAIQPKPALPRLAEVPEEGQAALVSAIGEETARVCALCFGKDLWSVVLTGSLARKEGSFVREDGLWKLRGDAELLLILKESAALPVPSKLDLLGKSIQDSLLRCGTLCHLCLSAAHADYFRRLQPHIFAYELRICGQVVWGDPGILALIPDFSPSDIPLEDAWRLLCNRVIEQIEVVCAPAEASPVLPQELCYRTVKLYLDMATSLLLFAGAYEPTYRRRAERLRCLAQDTSGGIPSPFPLREFSQRVNACTQWKLSPGNSLPDGTGGELWASAAVHAEQLWRWELARLTGMSAQAPMRELTMRWMKSQPFSERLRGWMYVVRKQGGLRSWRQWPRWARRACHGSPRYWIYAAAGELFSRLPCLLKPMNERPQVDADWNELRAWLPALAESKQGQKLPSWRQLAADIAWNYQQFLVETRS